MGFPEPFRAVPGGLCPVPSYLLDTHLAMGRENLQLSPHSVISSPHKRDQLDKLGVLFPPYCLGGT